MAEQFNPNEASSPVSVTTGATALLVANGNRTLLSLKAAAANTAVIYVTLDGTTPTAGNHHIELSPKEGVVYDSPAPGGAILALAASGTQSLCVVEA